MLIVQCSVVTVLLVTEAVSGAALYAWRSNEIGYDPSLDPVMWSRAFAQDTIRKPRYMEEFANVRHLEGIDKRDSKNWHRLSSHWTDDRVNGDQNAVHSDVGGFVRSGRKTMSDYSAVAHHKRGPKKMLHRRKRNKRNPRSELLR